MEVINGSFGSKEKTESDIPVQELVLGGIEQAGWTDRKEVKFFLAMDTEDEMTFVTNETSPADIVFMVEIVKQAIIGAQ